MGGPTLEMRVSVNDLVATFAIEYKSRLRNEEAKTMLNRRTFVAAFAMTFTAARTFAQQPQPTTGDASLKDTLVFGLRPRQPSDYQFVDLVAARVDDKTLPLELVI